MSSALDEDTRRTLDEGRATAGAMLRAAQKDLQKVFIVFLVGFLGTFYALRLYIWDILKNVTIAQMNAVTRGEFEIIAQTPFDVILLQAKIGLTTGLILALPVFVYFSRDALRDRDAWPSSPVPRWKLAVLGLLVAVLFAAGVAYGYLVFFPIMFSFLAGNAVSVGFAPRYSIVLWAQFIFLLSISFGLAAQMPLAITGLSYAEIVPYETFRDKWRHAVVAIFIFGALFSPPDPFTQIMWAVPLLFLYGFSLYLAKVVVTARRGSEHISLGSTARARWNLLGGAFVAGTAAVYFFFARGGIEAVNEVLAGYSDRRLPAADALVPLAPDVAAALLGAVVGALAALAVLAYAVYRELDAGLRPGTGRLGDPAGIDLGGLDAEGVRAAPPEAFADLTEDQALGYASEAIDGGDHAKAQAILDRYDETHEEETAARAAAAETGDGTETGVAAPATESPPDGALAAILRGRERVDWRGRLLKRWNLLAAAAVLAFATAYFGLIYGLGGYLAAEVFPHLPGGAGVPPLDDFLGTTRETALLVAGAVAAALALLVVLPAYYLFVAYRAGVDPTARDAAALDAEEVRAAPPELFAGMTESAAERAADRALRRGDEEAARAILDRYDEALAARQRKAEAVADREPGSVEDRATRATGSFLDEFTDGERDEDDIGGYYTDIAFILESLTSKSFRIAAVFGTVLVAVFFWLYRGGIRDVYTNFLDRLPAAVQPTDLTVVALHPVEALIFEVKFSTLVAALVTLPMLAYYAWPALRERRIVHQHRRVLFGWTAALTAGLLGGFVLGYTFIAPSIISYLVADAVQANMIISYRISDFFWLIIFTTAGIGLLADIPVLMVLLNTAGVRYRTMRHRWREVTVAILAFAAVFTPAGIVTMFLATVPMLIAYGVGLGILFVLTLGGRRDLARPRGAEA